MDTVRTKVEGATLYYTLSCKTGVTPVSLGARYTAAQLGANHPLVGSFILAPGMTLVLPMNIAGAVMQDPNTGHVLQRPRKRHYHAQ